MPQGRNFSSRVNHVQPGSPVSASNTSHATRDLEKRTNYLNEIIAAIEAGQLIAMENQAVSSDVTEGAAVYWDAENKRYALALAAAVNDPDLHVYTQADSAKCLGMCATKTNSTTGTIVLMGALRVTPTVVTQLIGDDATPGQYYLSAIEPGKVVLQKPPVSVSVIYLLGPTDACEEDSWIIVNPQPRDFLEDHIHYQIDLTPLPAGTHTPPLSGEPHEITDADEELPGWLPAAHSSFNSTAPVGAKFGYNIAAHASLSRVWPPLPITAAILEMFQPDLDGAPEKFEGLERVPSDTVQFTEHGIWWMTTCYNQVPWPTTYDSTSSISSSASSVSASSSSAAAEACPNESGMKVLLSFLKMTFATDKTVVTSLQPAAGSPLLYLNSDGTVAATGDLYADLDVTALVNTTPVRGIQALKEIADSSLTFNKGYITEGLVAGSDNVVLSGSFQELLDPDAAASGENPMLHQGIVTVDVQLDPTERELNPQVVKLGDALERTHKNTTYLGFPSSRDSAIRMRYNVPSSGLPTTPKLKIRALMFGRQVGPWAAMTMSYYRIIRPTDGAPFSLVAGDTSITFDVVAPSDDYDGGGTDLPADDVIEIESSEFTVAAGDTVFVTLARADDALPTFTADIGLIRIGGIIVAGA